MEISGQNFNILRNAVTNVVSALLDYTLIKATKYITPRLVVKATRKRYNKKITTGNIEISLTIGKPNYHEREFIKACKKAGEPFPVKKIQFSPKI